MGLEGFTQVAQGVQGLSQAAGSLYNAFGYNPKQSTSRISLGGGGIGGLSAAGGAPQLDGGGNSQFQFKGVESDIGPIGGRAIAAPQQPQLGNDHYSTLLKILGVPRG